MLQVAVAGATHMAGMAVEVGTSLTAVSSNEQLRMQQLMFSTSCESTIALQCVHDDQADTYVHGKSCYVVEHSQ